MATEENTPENSIEAERGPASRLEAAISERFAIRRPKDEEPTREPAAPMALETVREGTEPSVPSDTRRRMINEYRKRQAKQVQEERALPSSMLAIDGAEEEDEDEEPSPPQPPLPPPANNWIPIGPSVLRQGQMPSRSAMAGRIAGLAVSSSASRVYAASANGGVWRSDDSGETWHSTMEAWDLDPTTHSSDSLACGAIAIDSADPDRVYVGSGEGASVWVQSDGSIWGTTAFYGVGPIRSDDGGTSWYTEPTSTTATSLEGQAFYALAVDPGDRERVVGATTRGLYRRELILGGSTYHWVQKQTGVWTNVVAARSGSTTTFYAARWGSGVFRSNDGDSWTAVTTDFPTTNVGRIGLAVQSNNPDVVYALIAHSTRMTIRGVWRLDSNTWRQVTGHPSDLFGIGRGQGGYDLAVTVDPNNVNRIYLGGSTRSAAGAIHPADAWAGNLYRCIVTSSGSGSSLSYGMTNTAIGGTVHADIHTLVFTPGNSNRLWVGCDGGIFLTDNATGSASFMARNTGLSTLTMEHLSQHPTEDAVLFCGTQDNGTARFTGEEAWLHMAPGDGGFSVVNWNDPYRIVVTYPSTVVRRFTDGGSRYNYTDVTLSSFDDAIFYAPMVGTPRNPSSPSEAERIAIGTNRPWISDTFGGSWTSIPTGNTSDRLGTWTLTNDPRIKSMAFASYTRLYLGLMNGRIYRYDEGVTGWTRTRIDDDGGLPSDYSLPVTDIAVDLADASGDSIYVTFGGLAEDYRRVWHYDGTDWEQRSGPATNSSQQLLDVQHNAIVVDPTHPTHVYVGADIGIWRSTDSGATWAPFSQGLPDTAVFDLLLHDGQRLLRAATHGRGVYERRLDTTTAQGVELYVRDTQLDQGRFTTVNGRNDPIAPGLQVQHWRGPDIKLDTPDAMGNYQFPPTDNIDFYEFVDKLSDDSRNVATHATATITTRVYVQVHNRGITPANNVRVMLLLANASAGLPALPANYQINVQNGTPISTTHWQTVGTVSLDDVRVGAPKIAAFNLTSDLLPPPASLAGNNHHCVLALLHHAEDPYTSSVTHTDNNSLQERKAAHKSLKVVQFRATLASAPVIVPIRINNAFLEEHLLTRILVQLKGYPGRVRIFIPPMNIDGHFEDVLEGLNIGQEFDNFEDWAEQHQEMIRQNQDSEHPFNRLWVEQRIHDIELALASDVMLVTENPNQVGINRIVMEPNSYHTLFFLFDRPNAEIGDTFDLEFLQEDVIREQIIGGISTRVELVP
ncbi:MAG: hypothetical protein AB4038_06605 [Prochloraceae cyanobacterium]